MVRFYLYTITFPSFLPAMRSQSRSSNSSINSPQTTKQTNLYRFLASIPHSLLMKMKSYLQRFERFPEMIQLKKHKISRYEDIYTIATLKENEQRIFTYKDELKNSIQEIANKFGRKYISIHDRLRKKLCKLSLSQLAKLVGADYQSQSSSQSQRSVQMNPKIAYRNHNSVKKFKQKLQQRRKASQEHHIEQVEKVVRGSQESLLESSRNNISQIRINQQKPSNQKQLYDLSNYFEKERFSQNVVKKWKQKNIQKLSSNQDQLQNDSKICYNFIKREYLFLNPNVMRSVWNNLTQEGLRNNIKLKSAQIKDKQSQKMDIEMFTPKDDRPPNQFEQQSNKIEIVQEDQIMRQSKEQMNQNERNSRLPAKQKSNEVHKYNRLFPRQFSPIIETSEPKTSNKGSQTCSSIVSTQKVPQQQSGEDIQSQIKDPMQMLSQIVSKCNPKTLTREARKLMNEGLMISKRIANERKMEQILSNGKGIQPEEGSDGEDEDEQEEENNSDDYSSDSDVTSLEGSEGESKPMIYWFNNDPKIYENYQEHPYDVGYLLWTEEEDEIIYKAKRNLLDYFDEFMWLIEEKTPSYLLARMEFLGVRPSTKMRQLIDRFSFKM